MSQLVLVVQCYTFIVINPPMPDGDNNNVFYCIGTI